MQKGLSLSTYEMAKHDAAKVPGCGGCVPSSGALTANASAHDSKRLLYTLNTSNITMSKTAQYIPQTRQSYPPRAVCDKALNASPNLGAVTVL